MGQNTNPLKCTGPYLDDMLPIRDLVAVATAIRRRFASIAIGHGQQAGTTWTMAMESRLRMRHLRNGWHMFLRRHGSHVGAGGG